MMSPGQMKSKTIRFVNMLVSSVVDDESRTGEIKDYQIWYLLFVTSLLSTHNKE